jgi:hypothetical protein
MEPKTLGNHQGAYDAVFQHPIARNLHWKDLHSMLVAFSESTEEHGEKVKFTRNGLTLTVHPPQHKDFSDVEQLMKIRHYLERSEQPATEAVADGLHLLVVIDHREARIFKAEVHGTVPQLIAPYEEQGSHRHLHDGDGNTSGQRKPETAAFYDAIVQTLNDATTILIFGNSTGASSAMDHLVSELKAHHPAIAKRVVGAVVVDQTHMSDDQLLAEARTFHQLSAK